MTGALQRVAQRADEQAAHAAGVAEADLGLGRVDVDVDIARAKLDEQREQRIAAVGQEIAVGGAHGAEQQPVASPDGR